MESSFVVKLPFEVDFPALLERMRAKEGSRPAEELRRLAEKAQAIAQPMAIYKVAFVESRADGVVAIDGVSFASRVLQVNLDGIHRVFPFVGTAGREVAAWADAQEDLLAQFYADAVNEAILYAAMRSFQAHLTGRFGLSQTSTMNPGSLGDWPLSEQRPLFRLLGDVQGSIGVELTGSLLMTPAKSVSGIIFPSEATFANCQLCPREVCPNRRAPYDGGLFERRYKGGTNERTH